MVERSIMGKEHTFKELKVDIFKLKYYPENPRVHNIIMGLGKNPTQDKIEKIMWDADSTKDLFQDIKRSGLQDPILISQDFYVMEGNTRLCVFRYLFSQAKQEGDEKEMEKWRYIQCEMYPPGLDKLGMHYMLGKWHIKQKKDWDAFEKASYVKRLIKEFNKSTEEISKQLGIKESEIKKMLWVEGIMTQQKVTNIKQYSHFEQCYQKPQLRKKMDNDYALKKRIVNLIKNGNVGRAENIRRLPIIMEKEDGLDLLEDGVDFEKVHAKALEENPKENPLIKDIVKLSKKLDDLNTIEFLEEIKRDNTKLKALKTFFNKVDNLKNICKKRFE